MTYFIKSNSNKSIICGFIPDVWMIDNKIYGYKKCCINIENYIKDKKLNKNTNNKLSITKYSVVCNKCQSVILGVNVLDSNRKLSFDNWKTVVLSN